MFDLINSGYDVPYLDKRVLPQFYYSKINKIMKKVYLILTIIGFLAPNILVIQESIETGNIMLYANPMATLKGMFANRISSIFMIDLLFAVLVFFVWSYSESKKIGFNKLWVVWVLTMFFGLAGAFPLFLYVRALKLESTIPSPPR